LAASKPPSSCALLRDEPLMYYRASVWPTAGWLRLQQDAADDHRAGGHRPIRTDEHWVQWPKS
jgi:hypothetical protein